MRGEASPAELYKSPEEGSPLTPDFCTILEGEGGGGPVGRLLGRSPYFIEGDFAADEVFISSSSGGVTATTNTGPITEILMNEYIVKKEEYATEL